ncbi:MAG: hypothetical protein NTY38_01495 [Acidobacteria bacterium]|nr:hypothetical protein [Acidobacteriota bacterium]
MSPDLTKSRMITIRLTEEEFERVRAVSESSGAHSISDFARSAIHALLQNHNGAPLRPDSLELRFSSVYARLRALEERFEELHHASY